ncbi:MAG: hypothetical protein QNJ00_18135 [Woeseiaceae bacterium]|nr:hypothetical protein [Woeseiaceae bacterium]
MPAVAAAQADDDLLHPALTSKFTVDVGVFFPDRELDVVVRGNASSRDRQIDFYENLNLNSTEEIFATELAWRFGERWSFLAQYFRSSDTNVAELEEDVFFGDIVFNAGSNVVGGAELQLTRMFFGRKFDMRPRHDLGVGGGIHWLTLRNFIEGNIIINDVPTFTRRSVSAEAPLPNIGAWYRYSISPKWAFRSRFDLFSANIDAYSGVLINASAGLNYQLFEHVGVGLSYNYFELDVRVDKSDWRGSYETIYNGAYVYLSAFF